MGLGLLWKKSIARLLIGVTSGRLASLGPERCAILMYHRVLPTEKVTRNIEPGMYVTPESLRTHIRFLKKHFDIIPIAEAAELVSGQMRPQGNRPHCVLTFDDGWKDFYDYAWPVLKAENVPSVVYLPTAYIGTGRAFWTDRLAAVLALPYGESCLRMRLGKPTGGNPNQAGDTTKNHFGKVTEELKSYPYDRIEEILEECESDLGLDHDSTPRSFMDWTEIRELAAGGLVSFGSHTVNHAILTTLPAHKVQDELVSPLERIRAEKLDRGGKVPFCYPNGNHSEELTRQVAAVGYSSATTCDFGWNVASVDEPMSLKRIALHEDISSTWQLLALRLFQAL